MKHAILLMLLIAAAACNGGGNGGSNSDKLAMDGTFSAHMTLHRVWPDGSVNDYDIESVEAVFDQVEGGDTTFFGIPTSTDSATYRFRSDRTESLFGDGESPVYKMTFMGGGDATQAKVNTIVQVFSLQGNEISRSTNEWTYSEFAPIDYYATQSGNAQIQISHERMRMLMTNPDESELQFFLEFEYE